MKKLLSVLILLVCLAAKSFGQAETHSIIGPTIVKAGEIDHYSLVAPDGVRYDWTINGGIITDGQGTPNVTVTWLDNQQGSISVKITTPDNLTDFVVIDTEEN